MATPNMAAITASLERSLQSFSLNHQTTTTSGGGGRSSSSIIPESTTTNCHQSTTTSDATLELNSNLSLPYDWEQCLDLKTGEMYYINWRTGMKTKDDPRTVEDSFSGYFYSDDEEEEEVEDDDEEESLYDGSNGSDSGSGSGSSVESSPAASSSRKPKQNDDEDEGESRLSGNNNNNNNNNNNVLVVAGCKGCFMYFMVPKQVEDCPKCCGQLLHFDRSDDN